MAEKGKAPKNKPAKIFTLVFVLFSIGLLVYALINRNSSVAPMSETPATQTKTVGSVEISATPLLTSSSSDFDISLNTHSKELNYDLAASATLINDRGQILKPIKWEGDGPGGHHRTGKLTFTTFNEKPKTLNLTINNIEGQDLNFKWDL